MIKRTLSTKVTCEGCFFWDPVDNKGHCNQTPGNPCAEYNEHSQLVYYILRKRKMKNKMKQWRREARLHNEEAGRKHCGRENKPAYNNTYAGMSPLLQALYQRAGILT